MPRRLAPASRLHVQKVESALALLREARGLLDEAGAPAALASVRAAIKSTDGALRHVQRRAEACAARF